MSSRGCTVQRGCLDSMETAHITIQIVCCRVCTSAAEGVFNNMGCAAESSNIGTQRQKSLQGDVCCCHCKAAPPDVTAMLLVDIAWIENMTVVMTSPLGHTNTQLPVGVEHDFGCCASGHLEADLQLRRSLMQPEVGGAMRFSRGVAYLNPQGAGAPPQGRAVLRQGHRRRIWWLRPSLRCRRARRALPPVLCANKAAWRPCNR